MTRAPIALSDQQLDAVYAACRPLAPEVRDEFLRRLANALDGGPVGDGQLWRTIKALQRELFQPPDLTKHAGRTVHRTPSGPPIP
jgi:hypothetical protein